LKGSNCRSRRRLEEAEDSFSSFKIDGTGRSLDELKAFKEV
jgi:hypothetical protein